MALHTLRGADVQNCAREIKTLRDRDQRLDTEIRGSNKINKYEEKKPGCKLLIYVKRYHSSQSPSFF